MCSFSQHLVFKWGWRSEYQIILDKAEIANSLTDHSECAIREGRVCWLQVFIFNNSAFYFRMEESCDLGRIPEFTIEINEIINDIIMSQIHYKIEYVLKNTYQCLQRIKV